ncbi:uncharacterized [Lates japonicus]
MFLIASFCDSTTLHLSVSSSYSFSSSFFLSFFLSIFVPSLFCFLSSHQLRPWEGWTLMTDKLGSRHKMEGQLLETCKDLSTSERQLATAELEGELRPNEAL